MEKQYATKLQAYDAEIEPLVNKIHDMCEKHEINSFMIFQLDSDGKQTEFARAANFAKNEKIEVAPELIAMTAIAEEETWLAVGVLRAVASPREHQSAAANPHGLAE